MELGCCSLPRLQISENRSEGQNLRRRWYSELPTMTDFNFLWQSEYAPFPIDSNNAGGVVGFS
ncbi:MAG TPA: hypothetical protein QF901_14435, partial [Gammaproteobacteria bacterium]|nr:hypothetical protein [Gammaproteobacteria bacterium]